MNAPRQYRESDIMHENGRFWVLRVPGKVGQYEVLRNDATHAVHRATYHISRNPKRALAAAINDCDRRANGTHWYKGKDDR